MIDEKEIKRVNRKANLWLAAYLVLIVASLVSTTGPGWLTAITIAATVISGILYFRYADRAWDALLDAADELGLRTWKHKHYDPDSKRKEQR
jgi:hypothetical protein